MFKDHLSWSIWLYKDIGFQGMVYVSRDTPYMRLFAPFLAKKYRLAIDSWGSDDKDVRHIYDPLVKLIEDNVPDESHRQLYPYPIWTIKGRVERLARFSLLSEYMVKQWAEHFRGMQEDQLDELAQSFKFEACLKRDGLNKILTEYAKHSQSAGA